MSIDKEIFLEDIKKISNEPNNSNTSIYKIIDIIQKMNEVLKDDMVSHETMILDNNIYYEIRKEVGKILEYNIVLNNFIDSDKLVYDSFKTLYTSCSNGLFPLPSNELIRKDQRNLINNLFEERFLLTKEYNRHFNPTITENQFFNLKQMVSKVNLYYNSSGGYIASSSQNSPLLVINNLFESIKNIVDYSSKITIK